MALFSECTDSCAQKLLDTADIVREAIYRQSSEGLRLLGNDGEGQSGQLR
jgi:hypothetical protein